MTPFTVLLAHLKVQGFGVVRATKILVKEGDELVSKGCFDDPGALNYARTQFPDCQEEEVWVLVGSESDGKPFCYELKKERLNVLGRST